MKIDPKMLTYVEQLKENPFAELEDFPEIPSITESHFDTAIELSEKFVHKKNGYLTEYLMTHREHFVRGREKNLAYTCKTVKELKSYLKRELPKFWKWEKQEEMVMMIDAAFPVESYRPFFKLQKIVSVLQTPIFYKTLMNKSLEAANQVDLNEVKELIEECKQIEDQVSLKEEN